MTSAVEPIRTACLADPPFTVGAHVTLGEGEAHHLRVLRLAVGARIALRDGAGHTATGRLVRISKAHALVEVDEAAEVEPPAPIHLLVPVADRDRMLWLAEKAAELGVASWRPVLWHRSRSVSPRGDGPTFRGKVRARMVAAMLQSRFSWLPELFPEATPEHAIAAAPAGGRIALAQEGGAMLAATAPAPITLAVGPEGGFEPRELEQLVQGGFTLCTLGPSVLRFETAAVAGVAVARSMLLTTPTHV